MSFIDFADSICPTDISSTEGRLSLTPADLEGGSELEPGIVTGGEDSPFDLFICTWFSQYFALSRASSKSTTSLLHFSFASLALAFIVSRLILVVTIFRSLTRLFQIYNELTALFLCFFGTSFHCFEVDLGCHYISLSHAPLPNLQRAYCTFPLLLWH